jgi:hypothetical protein
MDGGGRRLPADGDCGRPPADGAAVRLRRTALEDGPGGRWTATPSSSRRAVNPLRPSVAVADGLAIRRRTAAKADVRGIVGRVWMSGGHGRGRLDVRRTRPWTSGRVTTLIRKLVLQTYHRVGDGVMSHRSSGSASPLFRRWKRYL